MRHPARRGTVLVTVLVVTALAVLVAGAMALRSQSRLEGASVELRRTRLRSAAWAGVQGVMVELASQREDLLDGGTPALTQSWTLGEGSRPHAIITLESLGDAVAQSELGKIDLNRATPEMLEKLPGMTRELAAALVAQRAASPLQSAEQAVGVALDAEEFYGSPGSNSPGEPGEADTPDPSAPALHRFLTVFAFDPNTQVGLGLGPAGGEYRGTPRVEQGLGWSAEIERELQRRLSPEAVAGAQAVLKARDVKTPSGMVRILRGAGLTPQQWCEVLDVLTPEDELYLRGRVDLSHAPAAVLACVPGVPLEAATRIVQARQGLAPQTRRLVTWPLTEGILEPEQFDQAVDWLTTRSMFWRVRVRAELRDAGDETPPDQSARGGGQRMVWEAVVDVSEVRPRVAYLRDVTHLDESLRGAQVLAEQEQAQQPEAAPEASPAPEPPPQPGEPGGNGRRRPGNNVREDPFQIPESLGGTTTRGVDSGRSRAGTEPPAQPESRSRAPLRGLKDRRVGRWTGGGGR